MNCDRPTVGPWETYTITDNGNNTITLRGGQGKVCGDHNKYNMICSYDEIGPWQQWTIVPI